MGTGDAIILGLLFAVLVKILFFSSQGGVEDTGFYAVFFSEDGTYKVICGSCAAARFDARMITERELKMIFGRGPRVCSKCKVEKEKK